MFFHSPQFDLDLLTFVNQTGHTTWLNMPMELLSSKIALFVVLSFVLAWTCRKFGRRMLPLFLLLILGMGASDLTTSMIKAQVQRVRPLNALPMINYVEDGEWRQRAEDFVSTKTAGTSYPSGHSANTACMAVLAMLLFPPIGKKALLLPLFVGYSRLYLGKHYPSDVLFGWLYGAVVAGFIWLAWSLWIKKWAAQKWPAWVENAD